MIKTKITGILLSLVLLFSCLCATAQESTIRATVEKNTILIGEPLELTVEAIIPGNDPIRFIHIDSLPHFEILRTSIDTVDESGGTWIKGIYTITSFDSGQWVIPSFVLFGKTQTDTIQVNVIFSPFDPNQDYHDIKDILEVKVKEKKNPWWWYAAAGGVLLLLLLIWYLLRKKKPVPVLKQEVVVNAYEEATRQLALLQKERPQAKEFYSRLTDIFRLYILRRKGILSLQKTTDDLVLQLRSLEMGKESYHQLSQSLRLSDFVKFAKYVPSEEDNNLAFETIKRSIDIIEQLK